MELPVEAAMVQVIENRSDLEGTVRDVKDDPARPGHALVTLDVSSVQNVESFPNLLGETMGNRVEIVMPAGKAGPLRPGSVVRCRSRRAGPATIYADDCIPLS